MLQACECTKHYMKYETVTKTGEERQETYPLPQICVSQAEISDQALDSLALTARHGTIFLP